MSDIFSQTKRSDIMSKISSKDTKPEILVRKFLFSKGFRYRINVKTLPGKPDIVLPKYKTIIFVNGCFYRTNITDANIPSCQNQMSSSEKRNLSETLFDISVVKRN